MEEFDYVIIGAGSAGCVLAHRLTETGNHSVCVIEAGPPDRNPFIHIPAGYVKNVMNKDLTWGFVSQPVPGIGGRSVGLPQGKTLGGSSAINGMVYNRGQRADYDGWAQRGNPGWSYDNVLPAFRRSEKRGGAADQDYRGTDGPLTVTDPAFDNPLCRMFVEAAREMGIPEVEDYNAAAQEGVGGFQFTIDLSGRRSVRMSTARAFLHPAERTGRVSVRTHAYAARILFEGKRAIGLRYHAGGPHGTPSEVRARREVILSAGALNSPRLLQISGIGDPRHLRGLGVDPVAALPGVGANLTDHYQVRAAVRLKDIRTVNERGRGLALVSEVAKWALGSRDTILGMGPVPMRVFMRSDPALDAPDLQLSFTPASYREGVAGLLDRYPGMTCGGYMQRPESRGWVRAVSTDLAVQPEIQPNYLATERDRMAIVQVLKYARQLLGAKSFAPYYVREEFPGDKVSTDDEILDFARQFGGTAFHHCGTARMGPASDPMAVVDERLRVHGLEGLRVVDASIMPAIISGNTNAPTIMIAEKAAEMIRADNAA